MRTFRLYLFSCICVTVVLSGPVSAEPAPEDPLLSAAMKAIDNREFQAIEQDIHKRLAEALAEPDKRPPASAVDLAAWGRLGAFWRGLRAPGEEQKRQIRELLARPKLRRRLLLAFEPETDLPDGVLRVLAVLDSIDGKNKPPTPDTLPALAAAMALTWDNWEDTAPEGQRRSMPPSKLRDASHVQRVWRALTVEKPAAERAAKLPLQLGAYVAAIRLDAREIQWAHKTLGELETPAEVFARIPYKPGQGYSDKTLEGGKSDFRLPNIYKKGGGSDERSYVAVQGSRVFAVPAAIVSAKDAAIRPRHWVAFLHVDRRNRAEWNLSIGRQGLAARAIGQVHDPQTGRRIAAGALALTARLWNTKAEDRLASLALLRAAELAEGANRLARVQSAVRLSPGNWKAYQALPPAAEGADANTLMAEIDRLRKLAGEPGSHFVGGLAVQLARLLPPDRRAVPLRQLDRDFRGDRWIQAELELLRAETYLAEERESRALRIYQQALSRYYLVPGIPVRAMEAIERIMGAEKREQYLRALAAVWQKLPRPKYKAQWDASDWRRLGRKLRAALAEAGNEAAAEKIDEALSNAERSLK